MLIAGWCKFFVGLTEACCVRPYASRRQSTHTGGTWYWTCWGRGPWQDTWNTSDRVIDPTCAQPRPLFFAGQLFFFLVSSLRQEILILFEWKGCYWRCAWKNDIVYTFMHALPVTFDAVHALWLPSRKPHLYFLVRFIINHNNIMRQPGCMIACIALYVLGHDECQSLAVLSTYIARPRKQNANPLQTFTVQ